MTMRAPLYAKVRTTLGAMWPWAVLAAGSLASPAQAQESHRIVAADAVPVFLDVHEPSVPARATLLLFHQAGGDARGEYASIVPRLLAEGYRVIAADTRKGGALFGGTNRVSELLGELSDLPAYCEVLPDVVAVLDWARVRWPDHRPVLWGSSFSAALVVRIAARRSSELSAVLAFSPASGEPLAACRPEDVADRVRVPLLALRPASEARLEAIVRQSERLTGAGHSVHVANPGSHGSSMLVAERSGGDVAAAEVTWRVVLDFIAAATAGAGGGGAP